MEICQHDGATAFRFQLKGRLDGAQVENLEHAWRCASSVLRGRELVIDISGLTGADPRGVALLSRLRESGGALWVPRPFNLLNSREPWAFRRHPRLSRLMACAGSSGGRNQIAVNRWRGGLHALAARRQVMAIGRWLGGAKPLPVRATGPLPAAVRR